MEIEERNVPLAVMLRSLREIPTSDLAIGSKLSPDKKVVAVLGKSINNQTTVSVRFLGANDTCGIETDIVNVALQHSDYCEHRAADLLWLPYDKDAKVQQLIAATEQSVAFVRLFVPPTAGCPGAPGVPALDALNLAPVKEDLNLACRTWNAETEKKTIDQTKGRNVAAFVYAFHEGFKGVFVPRNVNVLRFIGFWAFRNDRIIVATEIQPSMAFDDDVPATKPERETMDVGISVLKYDNDGIKLTRFFSAKVLSNSKEEKKLCVTCAEWGVFILSGGRTVHILDSRNAMSVAAITLPREPNEEDFDTLCVSPKLTHLAYCCSKSNVMHVLDLEEHFSCTPTSEWNMIDIKIPKHIELDPEPTDFQYMNFDGAPAHSSLKWDERISRISYSNTGTQDSVFSDQKAGRLFAAFSYENMLTSYRPARGGLSGFSFQKHKCSPSMSTIKQKVVHPGHAQKLVVQGIVEDKTVGSDLWFASNAFFWLRKDAENGKPSLWIYYQKSRWECDYYSFENAPVFLFDVNASELFAFMSSGGLQGFATFVFGQSEQNVINNLVMFDLAEAADSLCLLNRWNSSARRLNSLELGLKYSRKDVVRHALHSLENDQKFAGLTMLLKSIQSMISEPTGKEAATELIVMGMEYAVMCILHPFSNGISQHPENEEKAMEFFSAALQGKDLSDAPQAVIKVLDVTNELLRLREMITKSKDATKERHRGDDFMRYDHIISTVREDMFFPRNYVDRWLRMSDIMIINEALIGGYLSLAITFLIFFRGEDFNKVMTGQSIVPLSDEWVRIIAAELAYQASCERNYQNAFCLLSNAGMKPHEALFQLLFLTTRRNMRNDLLSSLSAEKLVQESADIVEFAKILESLYPYPSYKMERTRLAEYGQATFGEQITTRPYGESPWGVINEETDDLTEMLCKKYGFAKMSDDNPMMTSNGVALQILSEFRGRNSAARIRGDLPGGFVRFSLFWLSQWDQGTRERVLIEKEHHLAARSPHYMLAYALAHNDFSVFESWKTVFDTEADAHGAQSAFDISAFTEDMCKTGTPRMVLALLSFFASYHLFPMNGKAVHSPVRLSAMSKSLYRKKKDEVVTDTRKETLKEAMKLMAANGCYSAMIKLYRQYKESFPEKITFANAWADFVMNLTCIWDREQYTSSLFEAAMINAKAILMKNSMPANEDQIITTFFRETAAYPFVALALSFYSKEPFQNQIEVSGKYPSLQRAYSNYLSEAYNQEDVEAPEGFETYSSNMDTTFSDLFGSTSIVDTCTKLFGAEKDFFNAFDDKFSFALSIDFFISRLLPFQGAAWARENLSAGFDFEGRMLEICTKQPHNVSILGSACVFLELMSIDSLRLRTECTILATALTHEELVRKDIGTGAVKNAVMVARTDAEACQALISCMAKLCIDVDEEEAERISELCALFCTVHAMEPPIEVLVSFAKRNNWKSFLMFAHQHGYTNKELVVETIREHFPDARIRDHLVNVLTDYTAQEKKQSTGSASSDKNFLKVIERVERFGHAEDAIKVDVVSAASFPVPLSHITKEHLTEPAAALEIIRQKDVTIDQNADFRGAVERLLEQKKYVLVFSLEPIFVQCVFLAQMCKLLKCVNQKNFSALKSTLVEFLRYETRDTFENGLYIWAKDIAIRTLRAILVDAVNQNQRHIVARLINSLKEAGVHKLGDSFNFDYVMAIFSVVVHNRNIPLSVILQEPQQAIATMSSASFFEEAISLSKAFGYDISFVYIQKAEELVSLFKQQSCLWSDYSERVAMWVQIHNSFIPVGMNNKVAGNFFYEKANMVFGKEQLNLLVLSFFWFVNKPAAVTAPVFFSDDKKIKEDYISVEAIVDMVGGENVAELALDKPAGFLENMQANTIILAIAQDSQIELPKLVDNSFEGGIENTLDHLVERLVNKGKLGTANLLCKRFDKKSLVLTFAEHLLEIARGKYGVSTVERFEQLPESVRKSSRDATFEDFLFNLHDYSCEKNIDTFISKLLTDVRISKILSCMYDDVCAADPKDVVAEMCQHNNPVAQSFCADYVKYHLVPDKLVSDVVAQAMVNWISNKSNEIKKKPGSQALAHIVAAEWPKESILGYCSLAPRSMVADKIFEKALKTVPYPEEYGMRGPAVREHDAQVELAIICWMLYETSCNNEGCRKVLAVMLKQAIVYAARGTIEEFDLIKRIVFGTHAFTDLYPALDILLDHDHFELLLSREDNADSESFTQAELLKYLREHRPECKDVMDMVYLRFGLFDDLGKDLETEALVEVHHMAQSLVPKRKALIASALPKRASPSPDMVAEKEEAEIDTEQLSMVSKALPKSFKTSATMRPEEFTEHARQAVNKFLRAADHYKMQQCAASAERCLHSAALVGLQARNREACYVGLTTAEAKHLMSIQKEPGDALIIANVYGLRDDWTRSLYQQCVIKGNIEYYHQLERLVNIPNETWMELSRFFEFDVKGGSSPAPSQLSSLPQLNSGSVGVKTKNLKALLMEVNDKFVVYDVASKLGFKEIVQSLRGQVFGLKYFKKSL